MAVITTAGRLDMGAWSFPALQTSHLHGGSGSATAVSLQSDIDPYALVSFNAALLNGRLALTGSGFGAFDANGVPHAGVVSAVTINTLPGAEVVSFGGLSLPVSALLDAISSGSAAQLTAALTAGDDRIDGAADGHDFFGNPIGDVLIGGPGADTLNGRGGHDDLQGGDGDDLIRPTDGSVSVSRIDGGSGFDIVDYGQAGSAVTVDLASGAGGGQDTLSGLEGAIGGAYDDRLAGTAGAERFWGGGGADTLLGAGGDDDLDGGDGADRLEGGDGRDVLVGGRGADVLLGGAGDDVVTGTLFDTEVDGGDGADRITISRDDAEGAPRLASITAGAGDDQVILQQVGRQDAALRVDGGAGINTLTIAGAPGETLELYLDQSQPGAVTVALGFSSVTMTQQGPSLHVHVGSNAVTVTAAGLDDQLYGGPGADVLSDLYSLNGGGQESMLGGAGDDRILATSGSHYLRGDDGNDEVTGGTGFDDINGNMGADTCHGGAGDDWVVGGKDDDLLYGDEGADIVYGNLGNDTCDGGLGNDVIRGGQGDDILTGGAGEDWLSGDRGRDTIVGGAGADTFHAFSGCGADYVTDFSAAQGDRVQLDPGTVYSVRQTADGVMVDMDNNDFVLLVGVQLTSLPAGWIFGA